MTLHSACLFILYCPLSTSVTLWGWEMGLARWETGLKMSQSGRSLWRVVLMVRRDRRQVGKYQEKPGSVGTLRDMGSSGAPGAGGWEQQGRRRAAQGLWQLSLLTCSIRSENCPLLGAQALCVPPPLLPLEPRLLPSSIPGSFLPQPRGALPCSPLQGCSL
jgi:hypothetical protein